MLKSVITRPNFKSLRNKKKKRKTCAKLSPLKLKSRQKLLLSARNNLKMKGWLSKLQSQLKLKNASEELQRLKRRPKLSKLLPLKEQLKQQHKAKHFKKKLLMKRLAEKQMIRKKRKKLQRQVRRQERNMKRKRLSGLPNLKLSKHVKWLKLKKCEGSNLRKKRLQKRKLLKKLRDNQLTKTQRNQLRSRKDKHKRMHKELLLRKKRDWTRRLPRGLKLRRMLLKGLPSKRLRTIGQPWKLKRNRKEEKRRD